MVEDYRIVYKVGNNVHTEIVQRVVFSDIIKWFEERWSEGYRLISATRIEET